MGIKGTEYIRKEILQSKGEIRRQILGVRDEIPIESRERYDAAIRERMLGHKAYRDARIILAYANYRSEVDTMVLIEHALADGKYVFLPKVSGDDMEFWQVTAPEDLQSGYRGIPEPAESVSFPEWMTERGRGKNRTEEIVMMWMPGAVFDRERHRIGYGKGYYDRYLARVSDGQGYLHIEGVVYRFHTAALAYDCQIVWRIPYEEHDIRPDMVISESGIA